MTRQIAVITGFSAGIGRAAAMIVPADVAEQEQVEAAAERVEREWGPIAAWVNIAIATIFCNALGIAPADFRRKAHFDARLFSVLLRCLNLPRKLLPLNMIIFGGQQSRSALHSRSKPPCRNPLFMRLHSLPP